MRENRLFKRISFKAEGRLQLDDGDVPAASVNLSRGGACLRVDADVWKRLEEAGDFSGSLDVPDAAPLHFKARIAWSSAVGEVVHFGVEFLEKDADVLNEMIVEDIVEDATESPEFNI